MGKSQNKFIIMKQETYQDLENGLQSLLPFERQVLLAEIYHYAWYSNDAYKDLTEFIKKWETIIDKPVFFNQNEKHEPTNTSA